MVKPGGSWIAATVALAIAGCTAGGGLPVEPKKPTGVRGKDGGATVQPPAAPPSTAVGAGGGALISDHGAALAGVVRAPAGLVSNNGGNIITNKGGGMVGNGSSNIVSNNGPSRPSLASGAFLRPGDRSGYRVTQAPDQVPLAGVRVVLRDAAGQPMKGADGAELAAVTGPDGRYAFTAALPARALVLDVALPEGRGRLAALAVAGQSVRRADVDLVSTLTTTYILDQYVRAQADPLATIEKLPADVEAETRRATDAALAAGGIAIPDRLGDADVVATVTALRTKAPALDAQLEKVKRLLVAAGLSDLGAGRAARDVDLGEVSAIALAADGALLVGSHFSEASNRVWRVAPGGALETVAGGGNATRDALPGAVARDAGLFRVKAMATGPAGKLLVFEDRDRLPFPEFNPLGALTGGDAFGSIGPKSFRRLSWLLPDGTYQAVPGAPPNPAHVFVDGDALVVLTADGQHLRVAADGTRTVVFRHPPADLMRITASPWSARDAQGRLYLAEGSLTAGARRIYRCEAGGGAFKAVLGAGLNGPAADDRLLLDPAGHVLAWSPTSLAVTLHAPDGTTRALGGALPAQAAPVSALMAPDGRAYLVGAGGSVYLLADSAATRVAGLEKEAGAAAPGLATDTAFGKPRSLAIGPGGTLLVTDADQKRVLRFTPGDGPGAAYGAPEALLADEATALRPDWARVRLDGAGRLYVSTGGGIARQAADGTLAPLGAPPLAAKALDLAVAPDGTAYVVIERPAPLPPPASPAPASPAPTPSPLPVVQRVGDGAPEDVLASGLAAGERVLVACEPAGELVVVAVKGDAARTWRGRTAADLKAGPALTGLGGSPITALAVDPAGRLCLAQGAIAGFVDDLLNGGGLGFGLPGFPLPSPSRSAAPGHRVLRFEAAGGGPTVIAGQGGRLFSGSGVDDSLDTPTDLAFDAGGDLLVVDLGHRQVKRLPAAQLR